MKYFDWHTDSQKRVGLLMFIRVMIIVGLATLALAFFMVTRGSHGIKSTPSAKPVGTSTLSHGGQPATSPSNGLPYRSDESANDQDRAGKTK